MLPLLVLFLFEQVKFSLFYQTEKMNLSIFIFFFLPRLAWPGSHFTMKAVIYLDFLPHGGSGVPHVVSHLVTKKPLDMLSLDPVCMLALHGLPGGVVEPGAPHDLQAGTRPVDGVTLPVLKIYLVYSTTNYDEEISFVSDQFFRSEVSLALFALSS